MGETVVGRKEVEKRAVGGGRERGSKEKEGGNKEKDIRLCDL